MAYRKNIDSDERRLRELAKSLRSEPVVPHKHLKTETENVSTVVKRHEFAAPKIMVDCIKLLTIAALILAAQVTLSLTIF